MADRSHCLYTRAVISAPGDLSSRPSPGPWASELAVALYARFADGIARLDRFDPLVATLGKSYAGEERRLLYLMVRHAAPELVFELSPKRGWSTLHIAAAMEDNGHGKVISFELDPVYGHLARATLRRAGLGHRGRVVVGDVREKLPRVYERLRRDGRLSGIGFLFIDSEHSAAFATWYIENLFPLVVRGGLIHVHDIEGAPERAVSGAATVHSPLGEERTLAEHLIARREAYRWWSVAEAVRDSGYLERVRPFGGGGLALSSGRRPHPVEAALGIERNPTLWIEKLGAQETADYPYRPFEPLRWPLRRKLRNVIRRGLAFVYVPLRERRREWRRRTRVVAPPA